MSNRRIIISLLTASFVSSTVALISLMKETNRKLALQEKERVVEIKPNEGA
jgi:hypothetical protein